MTKADTAHLQAFEMRCQRRILGVRWFDKVKNAEITRNNPPHWPFSHRRDNSAPQALSLRPYRSHRPTDPCSHGPQVVPGHFDGSPGAGGLEETPGAPSHNMVRPDAEGHGQAGVNTMDPGAGPPAVGTGRYGSGGMRRRRISETVIK